MNIRTLCTVAVAVATQFIGTSAFADAIGESEYMKSCSNCHGADGKGGGDIVAYLNATLPDLTQIKKKNGGDFPYAYLIWMIDRRSMIPIHGGDMPVWGDRYSEDAAVILGGASDSDLNELIVRGRILSLVYYLESIQE